jgi:hypothetical protein
MKVVAASSNQFEAAIMLMTHCFIDDPVCR